MTATYENANATLSERVVFLLSNPATHAERPRQVEVIHTHISQVFLTDRHVYKLKKPVTFPFLDFSTLGKREKVCRDELRLNRRLAPGVYLDVVPLTEGRDGRLRLGGNGQVVDWLVKMRRLPADRALDQLIRSGRLTDGDMLRLTVALTTFYEEMPPLTMTTDEYVRRLGEHVRDNLQELVDVRSQVSSRSVRRIHAAQLRMLALDDELFRRRVLNGRLVEGHGDLRPEHVYLTVPPAIIDCIEFNRELRQLDVADELSFFAMECEHLGEAGVGQAVLDAYQRQSGDELPPPLLAFYKSYRACVRAKVSSLRMEQADAPDGAIFSQRAADYLALAERYAAQLGPPHVIVVGGLMGSGKTTLAVALADTLGCEILSTDQIRRELFGSTKQDHGYGQGPYQAQQRQQVYTEMHRRAQRLLANDVSVVLDGTYLRNQQRRAAVEAAQQYGAVVLLVECRCPDEVVIERMRDRRRMGSSDSDGRPALLEGQKRDYEPPAVDAPAMNLGSTEAIPQLQSKVFARLKALIAPAMESGAT